MEAQAALDAVEQRRRNTDQKDIVRWDEVKDARFAAETFLGAANVELRIAETQEGTANAAVEAANMTLAVRINELSSRTAAEAQGANVFVDLFSRRDELRTEAMTAYGEEITTCDDLEMSLVDSESGGAPWTLMHVAGGCAVGSMLGFAGFFFKAKAYPAAPGLSAPINV